MSYKDKDKEKEYRKQYWIKNKDILTIKKNIYRQNNKQKIAEYNKLWKNENKEHLIEYYREHADLYRENRKKWREENREKYLEIYTKYNKEHCGDVRKWRSSNREKYLSLCKKYYQENAMDPAYRLNNSIRVGVWRALSGAKSGRKWQSLVGYTLDELKKHLESKFTPEMNWNNQGNYWHVDHIRPVASFKFNSPEDAEFKQCWALANLQPLTADENRRKSDKLDWSYK